MNNTSITWQAPIHEHHEHSSDWYWAVGIITLSLAVAFFIAGNMLLSVIIIIGIGTLLMHTKNPPLIVDCEISRKGVRMGKTLYPWETLHSFWIISEAKTEKKNVNAKILLLSKKPLMPHIVIPLNPNMEDEVREILSEMLPEEPQMEPLPDRLMRIFGF